MRLDYLLKPVEPRRLADTVEKLMKGRQSMPIRNGNEFEKQSLLKKMTRFCKGW
jgi:response regulator of citrate/malate metabolism